MLRTSTRRPSTVASKATARSDWRRSPRNTWRSFSTSPAIVPDNRVATSDVCSCARSTLASARSIRTGPPRGASDTLPRARALPASSASTLVSASVVPFHAKSDAIDATGTRPRSSGPTASLRARSVPAKPAPSGRAASVSVSCVDGNASANFARSTLRASTSALVTSAGAKGVTPALTATFASRNAPAASMLIRSTVPDTASFALAVFHVPSPSNAKFADRS